MNSRDAKRILILHRETEHDAERAEALALVARDPELRRWFEQTTAFHGAVRERFQQIPVPAGLRESILSRNPIVRPAWWQSRGPLAIAAAVVLFIGISMIWFRPRPGDLFNDYRSRMVRSALKRYRMEMVTSKHTELRNFLDKRGGPADYEVPRRLEKLTLTGGACLRWHGKPVSMVCFDRGDGQMLFLFVLARSAVHDPPPAVPQKEKVNKLLTQSWSQGEKSYVLAGPENSDVFRGSPTDQDQ